MNAQKEEGSDSENFGTRITGFGVMVEKIWIFEVLELFLWIFLRLGTFLEIFFKFQDKLQNQTLQVNFRKTEGLEYKICKNWTAGWFQRNTGASLQDSRKYW
jgi:hypothetical protein